MDSAASVRALLAGKVLDLVGEHMETGRKELAEVVTSLVERASDAELEALIDRVQSDDYDFSYHPPVELARALHHALSEFVLPPGSILEGRELLQPVSGRSLVLLPNHLSYADANVIQIALARAGEEALSRRLTAVAGPKVYSDSWRRFSSLCFGTIKTAQSSGRASGEALMRPRDVAKIAQQTIAAAFERLDAGDALLLFPEGTRSRDVALQPLLPAVARYCERPDTWVVPMGVTGTERLFGFGDTRVQSTRVTVKIGPPLPAAELRDRCRNNRAKIAETLGQMIAACLPAEYRGAYA